MTIYNIANNGTHKYATISIIMLTAFDITTFGLSPPWLSKSRADVTRSPNEGYQRTDVFQIIFFKKGKKESASFVSKLMQILMCFKTSIVCYFQYCPAVSHRVRTVESAQMLPQSVDICFHATVLQHTLDSTVTQVITP